MTNSSEQLLESPNGSLQLQHIATLMLNFRPITVFVKNKNVLHKPNQLERHFYVSFTPTAVLYTKSLDSTEIIRKSCHNEFKVEMS